MRCVLAVSQQNRVMRMLHTASHLHARGFVQAGPWTRKRQMHMSTVSSLQIADMAVGWNADTHFRVTGELEAALTEMLDEDSRRKAVRREKNRQSALAARERR